MPYLFVLFFFTQELSIQPAVRRVPSVTSPAVLLNPTVTRARRATTVLMRVPSNQRVFVTNVIIAPILQTSWQQGRQATCVLQDFIVWIRRDCHMLVHQVI